MFQQLMEITLFGNFFIFATIFLAWIISLFYSEVIRDGFVAFFFTVAFVVMVYFGGTAPFRIDWNWNHLWMYLIIGFVYSLIRAFIFYRQEVRKMLLRKREIDLGEKQDWQTYDPQSVKSHASRWWFLWPISLFVWIFTDLFKIISDYAVKLCEGIYDYVGILASKTVKLDPLTEEQVAKLNAKLELVKTDKESKKIRKKERAERIPNGNTHSE